MKSGNWKAQGVFRKMEGAVYSRILAVLSPGFCDTVPITSSRYP
jgi:hypothetical protein